MAGAERLASSRQGAAGAAGAEKGSEGMMGLAHVGIGEGRATARFAAGATRRPEAAHVG